MAHACAGGRPLRATACEGVARPHIGIKVRLADFTSVTRARTVAEHTNDPEIVADLACELLRAYEPSQPVRLLGVRVASFEGESAPQLPAPAREPWEQLRIPGIGVPVITSPER